MRNLTYCLKTNAFRTGRVNVIFLLMAELVNHTGDNEKGQTGLLSRLSLSAERAGWHSSTNLGILFGNWREYLQITHGYDRLLAGSQI